MSRIIDWEAFLECPVRVDFQQQSTVILFHSIVEIAFHCCETEPLSIETLNAATDSNGVGLEPVLWYSLPLSGNSDEGEQDGDDGFLVHIRIVLFVEYRSDDIIMW